MRGALARFAWRLWRGDAGPAGSAVSVALLPFEGLWRLVTHLRNHGHDRSVAARVEGLTVVSVGNLAVGGTGKTPMSAWVASVLREAGRSPALLLSGYGEDEVALHRAWNPDVPAYAAADRVEAAKAARADGSDVAVLDDGFQHRRLGRSLDVVLLSEADPIPGAVLPRGPYREPVAALRRADVVVVTRRGSGRVGARARLEALRRRGALPDGVTTAGARLAPEVAVALTHWVAERTRPSDETGRATISGPSAYDASGGVLALTSIARPDRFRGNVAELTGATTELLAYADHHAFSEDDARRAHRIAGGRPIFITEKDAVKLKEHSAALGDAWVVVEQIEWDWGEDEVRARLWAVLGHEKEEHP